MEMFYVNGNEWLDAWLAILKTNIHTTPRLFKKSHTAPIFCALVVFETGENILYISLSSLVPPTRHATKWMN